MKYNVKKLFFALVVTLTALGCGGTSSSTATYPNSGLLVDGTWLSANLTASNLVIADVRSSTNYDAGHIPGAINITLSDFDDGSVAKILKSTSEVETILGTAGISASSTVVVYSSSVDASAGRLFWILEYMGHSDVHILDGGYGKWDADSRTTETTANTGTATTYAASVDDAKIAAKAYVASNYNDTTFKVVDSRNAADYDTSHIPSAINILVNDYLDMSADNSYGTVKSYADLTTFLDSKSLTGMNMITHCYVGYRSGQGYFIYRLMGYTVRNYDGSWNEWSADTNLPTEP